jgi:uncharacterized protein involved in exopolysaccharide biosynthesis
VCCEGKQKQTKKQRKGLKIQEELKKASVKNSVKRRQEDLKKAAAQKEKVKIKERNALQRNQDLGFRRKLFFLIN